LGCWAISNWFDCLLAWSSATEADVSSASVTATTATSHRRLGQATAASALAETGELRRRLGRYDGLADSAARPIRRRGRYGGVAETGEPWRRQGILDDYCRMTGWDYCRFDGSTGRAMRNYIVQSFNRPGSSKFIFLMSTRSGGE
jgi:hypothetical protein